MSTATVYTGVAAPTERTVSALYSFSRARVYRVKTSERSLEKTNLT